MTQMALELIQTCNEWLTRLVADHMVHINGLMLIDSGC